VSGRFARYHPETQSSAMHRDLDQRYASKWVVARDQFVETVRQPLTLSNTRFPVADARLGCHCAKIPPVRNLAVGEACKKGLTGAQQH
jgi:hypothetical protein